MNGMRKAGRALRRIIGELGRTKPEYRPWVLAWALGWLTQVDGPEALNHFEFGLKGFLGEKRGEEEYASNYPMKSKEMVSKIKGARKFVKSKDLPSGGGVGKSVNPVSPGSKPKAKKKKKR